MWNSKAIIITIEYACTIWILFKETFSSTNASNYLGSREINVKECLNFLVDSIHFILTLKSKMLSTFLAPSKLYKYICWMDCQSDVWHLAWCKEVDAALDPCTFVKFFCNAMQSISCIWMTSLNRLKKPYLFRILGTMRNAWNLLSHSVVF